MKSKHGWPARQKSDSLHAVLNENILGRRKKVGIAAKHLGESLRAEIARTLFKVTSVEEGKGELHGLCPIHGEKNPSFAYNYKKDLYHCLACGADGDLLRLWSEVKGLGKKEGFKAFCDEFKVPFGERKNGKAIGREAGDEVPAPPSVDIPPDVLRFFEYGVNKRFSFKPRLLAEHVISEYRLLSDPETGLLYRWNGMFWEIFDEDHIKAVAIRCMGNEAQKSRIEDAIYQARMLSTIPPDRKVNDRHEWICLQNGMLNFMTFEIRPHAEDFFCTHALPVSFEPDSQKRCERWEQYLRTNIQTPEAIAQAQEFAGYCLVRHTRFEKCLFLLGPGRDGKSTFMKVLKEIIGDVNCAAVSFPDLENEFHRSSLYNKLLNISTEIGGQAIESPYFKAITSGDPINAAYKHRDAFTFSPYCKLVFAGNMLPRVKDNSDAYFQRVLPIQFKRQFLEGDPDRDPELMEKFKMELSEIFFWALCGLKRLTDQKRFTDSAETRDLLMGYRRSNNPVLCYVEDQCELGDGKSEQKSKLYTDYRSYCGLNGYMPVNKENFFRELYSAVHNLRTYRPRVAHQQIAVLRGIAIRREGVS